MLQITWISDSFPPLWPLFDTKSGHGEFVVDKMALGRIARLHKRDTAFTNKIPHRQTEVSAALPCTDWRLLVHSKHVTIFCH
jgi:hypothetical protein